MYKYLYAVGCYNGPQPGYHNVDISQWRISDLEKAFSILYIVVRDEMLNDTAAITLDEYRISFSKTPTITIQAWLDQQSQTPLKYADVLPGEELRYAKMERLFTHGYFHFPGDINLTKDRQKDLLSDSAPDVLVKHYKYVSGINYNKQADYALFSINGVFYRGTGRVDGVYLHQAGLDYIQNRRDLRIGAMSFEKLGKLKAYPITREKLLTYPSNGEQYYKFSIPEAELNNKTVWLVVNGQLIVDPEMIYRTGPDYLTIKLTGFDAMKHFQVYREYCRTPELKDMTKIDKYKEDALCMHNSFVLTIDNPTLGVEVVPLTTMLHPNVLHTEERFQHPIVLDTGLFPVPYMRSYGIKQRLLNFDLRINRVYPIQTAGAKGEQKVNSLYVNQGNPGYLPKGYFFKIHGITMKSK